MVEIHSYDIVKYKNSLEDLISPYYIEGEKLNLDKDGDHVALIISFTLKSSCYATMFLRELMREGRDLGVAEVKPEVEEQNEEEEAK